MKGCILIQAEYNIAEREFRDKVYKLRQSLTPSGRKVLVRVDKNPLFIQWEKELQSILLQPRSYPPLYKSVWWTFLVCIRRYRIPKDLLKDMYRNYVRRNLKCCGVQIPPQVDFSNILYRDFMERHMILHHGIRFCDYDPNSSCKHNVKRHCASTIVSSCAEADEYRQDEMCSICGHVLNVRYDYA